MLNPSPDIYKIHRIVDGVVTEIFVFYGNNTNTTGLSPTISDFFSNDELPSPLPKITMCPEFIYKDDTIEAIKLKLFNQLLLKSREMSIDEMYAYAEYLEPVQADAILNMLQWTPNSKTPTPLINIPNARFKLEQILRNILDIDLSTSGLFDVPENQEEQSHEATTIDQITFNIIMDKLGITNDIHSTKLHRCLKPIGVSNITESNSFSGFANPYATHVLQTTEMSDSESSVLRNDQLLNSNIFMNGGLPQNRTIFLHVANDLLPELSKKEPTLIINTLFTYYPYLYANNIQSIDDLISSKRIINEETQTRAKNIKMQSKAISSFYSISKNVEQVKSINDGITHIHAEIIPYGHSVVPLDIIIKQLHATNMFPLIGRNITKRHDPIIRLYTAHKVSVDGRKIPIMPKRDILSIIKQQNNQHVLYVFTTYTLNRTTYECICELTHTGSISVKMDFDSPHSKQDAEHILNEITTPLIQTIHNIGYNLSFIPFFKSFNDPRLHIHSINYAFEFDYVPQSKLKPFLACMSNVFMTDTSLQSVNLENELTYAKNKKATVKVTEQVFRFKRIHNFIDTLAHESEIIEKINAGQPHSSIIANIIQKYPTINNDEVKQIIRKFSSELKTLSRSNKKLKTVKYSPGFKTTIGYKSDKIMITIDKINHIQYLDTIPFYIHVVMQAMKRPTNVKPFIKLCKGSSEIINTIDDISLIANAQPDKIGKINDIDELVELEDEVIDFFSDDDEDVDKQEDEQENNNLNKSVDEHDDLEEFNIDIDLLSDEENFSDEEGFSDDESDQEGGNKNDEDDIDIDIDILDDIENDSGSDSELDTNANDNDTLIDALSDAELNEKLLKKIPKSLKLYFQNEIEKNDPELILKAPSGKFNSYARLCQLNSNRQPVIVGDAELNEIKEKNPGFLRPEDVVTYGSTPETTRNYMCPRYWCLKTNKPIYPHELTKDPKTGELEHIVRDENGQKIEHQSCGKILKPTDITVSHDRYIYDFTDTRDTAFPGLISGKHPKGHCLPCCFKKWNTVKRIAENKQCLEKANNNTSNVQVPAIINKRITKTQTQKQPVEPAQKIPEIQEKEVYEYTIPKNNAYILSPDVLPVQQGRWGYLPIPMQQILKTLNSDCYTSVENKLLKPDHPCFLRYGVEQSQTQSFIASISVASWFYSSRKKTKTPLSIKEFKKTIINQLQSTSPLPSGEYGLDLFMRLQNGNLVTTFAKLSEVPMDVDSNSVSLGELNSQYPSILYTKLTDEIEQSIYYRRVVYAFSQFIHFLSDDQGVIDHTWLWDLISTANPVIFSKGVNIALFNIPDSDITNNIELICPTNHYTLKPYNHVKPWLILLKRQNYYEPIFSYSVGASSTIIPLFHEKSSTLPPSVKQLIDQVIKPFMDNCRPIKTVMDNYETPILLETLVKTLVSLKYSIITQIMNFHGKIIGVMAHEPGSDNSDNGFFVPCYPSSLLPQLSYKLMNDETTSPIWNSYVPTIKFLIKLGEYNRSSRSKMVKYIPCRPHRKIVEDSHVVGILTETNQFVQLSEPIPEIEANRHNMKFGYNLPTLVAPQYLTKGEKDKNNQTDIIVATSTETDKQRVDYIDKLRAENMFYTMFRQTLKTSLHKVSNYSLLNELVQIYQSSLEYREKLDKIINILKNVNANPENNRVEFTGGPEYYHIIKKGVSQKSNSEENTHTDPYFLSIRDDVNNTTITIVPKENLNTGDDNDMIYYTKLADELTRNTRINASVFNPFDSSTFIDIEYSINLDEIVLFKSIIESDYFDDLVEYNKNPYTLSTIRENSNTSIKSTLDIPVELPNNSNKVTTNDVIINTLSCTVESGPAIVPLWRACFPSSYSTNVYTGTNDCTFQLVIDLVRLMTGKSINKTDIEVTLYNFYNRHIKTHKENVLAILAEEGKHLLATQFSKNIIKFDQVVFDPTYFLSPMDLWILFQHYKVNSTLLSNKSIAQSQSKDTIFSCYYDSSKSESVVFIILPAIRKYSIPAYKVIQSDYGIDSGHKKYSINMMDLRNHSVECSKRFDEAQNISENLTPEDYIKNYVKAPPRKQIRKNKQIKVTEQDLV